MKQFLHLIIRIISITLEEEM